MKRRGRNDKKENAEKNRSQNVLFNLGSKPIHHESTLLAYCHPKFKVKIKFLIIYSYLNKLIRLRFRKSLCCF
jgi:hypothetical protein